MTPPTDASASGDPGWRDLLAGGAGVRLLVLLSVIVLHAGGNYMVVTLAPAMVAEIGGAALIGALTALFNIATVLAATATGALAGRFRLGTLLWAMTIACAAGAALSASSDRMEMVAIGRAIAGFGGGGLLALAFIALRAEASPAAWPKVSALSGAFWIGAAFAGPLVGGVLADLTGWRAAFAALGAAAFLYAVGAGRVIAAATPDAVSERFPVLRFAGFGAGVALVSFAPLFDARAHALAAAGAGVALVVLAALRDRARAPRLFPRNAFRVETQQGCALLAKLTLGASAMSVLVFGPLLLSAVHGGSVLFAGGFVLIETLSWAAASFLVASLAPRPAFALARLGPALSLAGLAGCAVFLVDGRLPAAALSIAACGAGLGLAWPLLGMRIVAGAADPAGEDGGETAKTMAVLSGWETLGFAIGGALVGLAGSLVVGGEPEDAQAIQRAAAAGIMASMTLALGGALLCRRALRQPGRIAGRR